MTKKTDLLTPRELETLKFIAQGLSNKEISSRFCITYTTLKAHIGNIYQKFELFESETGAKRIQAALIYLKEVKTNE